MKKYVIGLYSYGHESAVALVNLKDKTLDFACAEERFSREKLTGKFPDKSLKYIFDNICTPDEVEEFVVPMNPMAWVKSRQGRRLSSWRNNWIEILYQVPARLELATGISANDNEDSCDESCVIADYGPDKIKTRFINHHKAHMWSALGLSKFDDCAFLTVDGKGERESLVWGTWENGVMTIMGRTFDPHSLGLVFTRVTHFLGYEFGDEWKIMGLAGVNKGSKKEQLRMLKKMETLFWYKYPASFRTDLIGGLPTAEQDQRPIMDEFMERFGLMRNPKGEITKHHILIAWALQKQFEQVMLKIMKDVRKLTGKKKIVCSGGCFMNSKFNGLNELYDLFDDVFVTDFSSDLGTPVGAALCRAYELTNMRVERTNHTFFGPSFDSTVDETLSQCGLRGRTADSEDKFLEMVVNWICNGAVVAVARGKMEYGQRALGHRSILADPRNENIKDIVNSKIKYREWYRPFAASVLANHVSDVYETKNDAYFMQRVAQVRPEWKKRIQGVVHFDGSGRYQSVDWSVDRWYYCLIKKFYDRTGVPLLLNTSFNLAGEPIVCTPRDAIRTFFSSGLDVLVLGCCRAITKGGL